MIKKFSREVLLVCYGLAIAACQPMSPEEKAGIDNTSTVITHDFTLSQGEFNDLTPDQQFVVANKLLSTMYRGIPADEFFNLEAGFENPEVGYGNFIVDTQVKLQTKLTQEELQQQNEYMFGIEDNPDTTDVNEEVQGRFNDFDSNHPHQIYMARAQSYPLSDDQFVTWMGYFLANTIMFSPAREMDSTDGQDIVRVLGYLEQALGEQRPIRDVIRGWLHNLSRWRVSRSPENHALEMYELYLGVFNDTPEEQQNTINGGIACDSWFLTDDQGDYQLLTDLTKVEGGRTVQVFGQYVSTCEDLYDVVAGHPLVIPRVTEVIVNYFLDGAEEATKLSLVESIVGTGPVTFHDVFMAVIFSKEFLLNTERVKTFEESAFGFLNSMNWNPRANADEIGRNALDNLLDSNRDNRNIAVHKMGWASMEYKIGRTPFVPMDALSFASYHKAIREEILLQNRGFDGRNFPELSDFDVYQEDANGNRIKDENGDDILVSEATEGPYPIYDGAFYKAGTEDLKESLENLTAEEFIDYVFLTALGRRATDEEVTGFIAEGESRDYVRVDEDGVNQLRRGQGGTNGDQLYEYWADDYAEIMFDYMSRLPEFYYFRAVN